ncbi:MAG: hypothetical protein DI535_17860 [Citrobacter freundii]|nr:MAG: hypothetical protein DI535_17860 [Citrobacter freundii]
MKTLIVYKGKYGATEQYAKWISADLHVSATDSTGLDAEELNDGNLLIMGSSVYIGKLQIAKWVRENESRLLKLRLVLFVVSGTPVNQTAKLFTYVKNSLPPNIFRQCRVFFLPGRLVYDRLSRKDRFMLRVGAFFAGRTTGAQMLSGYDDVKKEHLNEMLAYIRSLQDHATDKENGKATAIH